MEEPRSGQATGDAPVSVHFVNNVLAAAAGYIDDDPDLARDVLADLGSFLTHRLRGPRAVTVADELEHVAVYLRLEQARFPGRIVAELPAARELPPRRVKPGVIQAPVAEAVGRWLTRDHGRVRLALRARGDGVALQLDRPDAPGQAGERVRIPLGIAAEGSAA